MYKKIRGNESFISLCNCIQASVILTLLTNLGKSGRKLGNVGKFFCSTGISEYPKYLKNSGRVTSFCDKGFSVA